MGLMSREEQEQQNVSGGYNLVLVQAEQYGDAQQIGNYLKEGKAVLLNLEKADADVAKRIIDFLSGFVFCCNGKLERMSRTLLMAAPSDVSISGNFYGALDEDEEADSENEIDTDMF